jgi:hypothetical protein
MRRSNPGGEQTPKAIARSSPPTAMRKRLTVTPESALGKSDRSFDTLHDETVALVDRASEILAQAEA